MQCRLIWDLGRSNFDGLELEKPVWSGFKEGGQEEEWVTWTMTAPFKEFYKEERNGTVARRSGVRRGFLKVGRITAYL